MSKSKRKPFFLKENFQITFIIGFILLLLLEVTLAGLFIYKLSEEAVESAAFSSHINIDTTAQIIKPVILKVNIYMILASVFLAALAVAITYLKLYSLFGKIIKGLENLRDNDASFHITPCGGKQARELIKELNHAASCVDKRNNNLRRTLDSLLGEKELKHIAKLHDKLYSIVAGKNPG